MTRTHLCGRIDLHNAAHILDVESTRRDARAQEHARVRLLPRALALGDLVLARESTKRRQARLERERAVQAVDRNGRQERVRRHEALGLVLVVVDLVFLHRGRLVARRRAHAHLAQRAPPKVDGVGAAHEDEDLAPLAAARRLLPHEELAQEGDERDEPQLGRDDDKVVQELRGRGEARRERQGRCLGVVVHLAHFVPSLRRILRRRTLSRIRTTTRTGERRDVPPDRFLDAHVVPRAQHRHLSLRLAEGHPRQTVDPLARRRRAQDRPPAPLARGGTPRGRRVAALELLEDALHLLLEPEVHEAVALVDDEPPQADPRVTSCPRCARPSTERRVVGVAGAALRALDARGLPREAERLCRLEVVEEPSRGGDDDRAPLAEAALLVRAVGAADEESGRERTGRDAELGAAGGGRGVRREGGEERLEDGVDLGGELARWGEDERERADRAVGP